MHQRYRLRCLLCAVRCALYVLRRVLCGVRFTVCGVQCVVILCALCGVQRAVCNLRCLLCCVRCAQCGQVAARRKAVPLMLEDPHLYRWWTVDSDPESRPDSILDASRLPPEPNLPVSERVIMGATRHQASLDVSGSAVKEGARRIDTPGEGRE